MGTIKTGIPGLDELLGGGLVEGSTTLLSGRSGSGK
ncbi:MAG: ATPase domain-containing protein, partial [Candidatus Thorarchaeota archaeon]